MSFYAYIPRPDGTEPTGTTNKAIIRDLKTLNGVIKRLLTWHGWNEQPFRVFTFSNIYDDKTHKLIYTHTPPNPLTIDNNHTWFTSLPIIGFNENFQVRVQFTFQNWESLNHNRRVDVSGIPYIAKHEEYYVSVCFLVSLKTVGYLLGLLEINK